MASTDGRKTVTPSGRAVEVSNRAEGNFPRTRGAWYPMVRVQHSVRTKRARSLERREGVWLSSKRRTQNPTENRLLRASQFLEPPIPIVELAASGKPLHSLRCLPPAGQRSSLPRPAAQRSVSDGATLSCSPYRGTAGQRTQQQTESRPGAGEPAGRWTAGQGVAGEDAGAGRAAVRCEGALMQGHKKRNR